MRIALAEDCGVLRIGRKRLKVLPDSRRLYDFVCECDCEVDFSEVQHATVSQLPDRVRIQTRAGDCGYEYTTWVDITRHGKYARVELTCIYSFHRWREPVNLRDFHVEFARLLKKSKKLLLDIGTDEFDPYLYVSAAIDVAASTSLGAGCNEIANHLRWTHADARNRVAAAILATAPSPGRRRKPVAFICHDIRDKATTARPIADGLTALGCQVWYDEFTLRVGDALRESIERGLKETKKCIVIISPQFLKNVGWARAEFNAIFTRELIERRDILLPVWLGVRKEQVLNYSPSLANRFAVDWSVGLDEVVRKLCIALRGRNSEK